MYYLVEPGRLGVCWGVRVGVAKQRLDGGQDGGNIVDGRPLVLQDVEADRAVRVHVRVEELRHELDRRRLVRVVLRELELQAEGAVLPRRVVRAKDDGVPLHDVVILGRAADALRWVVLQPLEVAHQPAPGGGRHRLSASPGGRSGDQLD
eukprot:CAMPEP_0180065450 /NCGR_PEP_ID=MMETSP0985-20121206/8752_1 /TAXON_ID=483367 /ORGANISM="non described non described, Strain CCMP 2436" /LENGTH=149 /DNA_ID=CAMNT_0021995881 /DNA_START=748 /DNA_END=1197 /DNA_ORIENTATION=+